MSRTRQQELNIPQAVAAELGTSAAEAARTGSYLNRQRARIDWSREVRAACSAKASIPPDVQLPSHEDVLFPETRIQVTNETTLGASRRLAESELHPLALNFANGVNPGGGFLGGARAQEEVLCRSSALFATLTGDPMYHEHAKRPQSDSTDWAIYSPDVPVFRLDDGTELTQPWLLSFLTCAAPYAPSVGQPRAGDLLQERIHRVLAIGRAYGHRTLVLGAWGCGAFLNDPRRTALDFRRALEAEFSGAFSDVVFAIADWSPDRKFLGPFRDVFAPDNQAFMDRTVTAVAERLREDFTDLTGDRATWRSVAELCVMTIVRHLQSLARKKDVILTPRELSGLSRALGTPELAIRAGLSLDDVRLALAVTVTNLAKEFVRRTVLQVDDAKIAVHNVGGKLTVVMPRRELGRRD